MTNAAAKATTSTTKSTVKTIAGQPVVAGQVLAIVGPIASGTSDLLGHCEPALDPRDTVLRTVSRRGEHVADVMADLDLHRIARTRLADLDTEDRALVRTATMLTRRGPVLRLDEPTLGLTAGAARRVWEHLARRTRQGAAVAVASHDITEVEPVADTIVVVRNGEIIAAGAKDTLGGAAAVLSTITWIGPDGLHHHRTTNPDLIAAELVNQFGADIDIIAVTPISLQDTYLDLQAA